MVKIGIIALQGDIEEHIKAMERVLFERGGEVVAIKRSGMVPSCDAIVIPGGESTTIGLLMDREGITSEIKTAAKQGTPILGTCAGLILLSKLGMGIRVTRNAFGHQRESFEFPLKIGVIGDEPFNAVFIRAPAIVDVEKNVETLATYDGRIVAAKQDKLVALAFHPELTRDMRLHHFFLDLI
ncbi:MAG: pyridoxal 5'-phosphate synthase glutaminase subunit PdxT [Methanocellales archaeon]|nr:pyridoxal 5'-phosphate synthase glutaminase subunit PdxT [Methanocellales archaeon]